MSEVIVLSSSEDEAEIVSSKRNKNDQEIEGESRDSDFSLSEFPQINFNDIHSNASLSGNNGQEEDCSFSDILEVNNEMNNSIAETSKMKEAGASGGMNTNTKSSNAHDGSQSDSDYETQNNSVDYWGQYMAELKNKYNVDVDLSSDEDNKLEEAKEEKEEQKRKKGGGKYYQS